MQRIDKGTVDRIYDSARVEEVVGDYVSLKRRGTNMLGLCPFHDEKTPSFMVSPAKGIYKCFGCGKGGNAINFVMEVEQISYYEALKQVAQKYHIHIEEKELSPEEKKQFSDRDSMMVINEYARKYFSEQMMETAEGRSVGLGYFKQRGFTDQIIEKFNLGYAPEGKDIFTQEAVRQGYKEEFLDKTGLSIIKEDWKRDRFAGRVIFPIHGQSGKVVAFAGRTLSSDKKVAKYLNSPESEVYHKSSVLYGIYHAKKEIQRKDNCYLVEGYTDVMSLHQSGIENVVASSGTSLTQGQIRLIQRFTENVTVIYDGDNAGIKASLRGIDLILEQGLNVKVLLLPEGEDPDSFAKSMGASELLEYIEKNKTDFIHFKANLLMEGAQNDPIKKAKLITEIVKSIAVIPHEITRSIYLKECSNLLDVQEDMLFRECDKLIRAKQQDRHKEAERKMNRERAEARDRMQGAPDLPPDDMFLPPDMGGGMPVPSPVPAPVSKVPESPVERMVLMFLLRYGDVVLFHEGDKFFDDFQDAIVSEFIITYVEDFNLEFTVPIHQKVYSEYVKLWDAEEERPELRIQRSHDVEMSQFITDINMDRHELSKLYENASGIDSIEQRLGELVPKSLFDFRDEKLSERKKHLMELLNSDISDEEKDKVTTEFMDVLKEQKELNQNMGGRTFARK